LSGIADPSFIKSIATQSSRDKPEVDIKFYNYEPKDKTFAKFDPAHFKKVKSIEAYYQSKVKKMLKEYATFDKDAPSLLPKKLNADLKGYLANKIEKLDRRTERAVVQLIRELL
jgi:coiled-coil domain-containing protein 12